jgi:voltage-gated potassium channel
VSAVASGGDAVRVELPGAEPGPLRRILWRVALALGLITFVALLRTSGGMAMWTPRTTRSACSTRSTNSTVSITTTGCGDIRPVRVGTTIEFLAERSRQAYRRSRWRRNLNEHVILCGYGTKGRSAVRTLIGKGMPREQIVVLDENADVGLRRPAARARSPRAAGD